MHYYIDGYNLLFRTLRTDDELRRQREVLILELEAKVNFLQLDVTLVFDSHYRPDDGSYFHYNTLKICFTAEKESADDFIVKEIKASLKPTQQIVVTSDKLLADRCRRLSAKTEKIEEFIGWINKRYKNRKRQLKLQTQIHRQLPSNHLLTTPVDAPVISSESLIQKLLQNPLSSPEACFYAYLQVFEKTLPPVKKKVEKSTKKLRNRGKNKEIKIESGKNIEPDADRWMRLFTTGPTNS